MANEVIPFEVTFGNELEKQSLALPPQFNKTRAVQNALAVLKGNDTLEKFAKTYPDGYSQIIQKLVFCAVQGLDPYKKEAYLVPYGPVLNLMVSYKGAVKMVKKYSTRKIKDIYSKVVRDGDFFEETILDGHESVTFKPKAFNDGKVIGAFAVCLFEDGGMMVDTMSLKELEITRSASKQKNGSIWSRYTTEMYRKTVLHRLCKHIDTDMDDKAWEAWNSGMEIETDPKEQMKRDVSENANSEEFVIDAEEVIADE